MFLSISLFSRSLEALDSGAPVVMRNAAAPIRPDERQKGELFAGGSVGEGTEL